MYFRRFVLLFLPILIFGYGVFFEDLNTALDELFKNRCEYPIDIIPYSIAVSPSGHVWAVTNNALFEFDGERWQSHLEPYIYIDYANSVFIEFDREGRLWLGHNDGIMIYDGKDWIFYKAKDWGLPGTRVTSIAFAPDGRAWVGLARSGSLQDDPGGGISIFDGETWLTFHTRFANMTTYDDISTIQFDPQGRPWIGTSRGTVSVIEEIISFSTGGGSLPKYSIPEENTISAVEDEDGAIHYTAFTAQTYSQKSKPPIPLDYLGEVYSIDFDDQGDAWIYIHKYLYRFDGKSFKLMQTTEWDSMGNVIIDPQGNIWLGLKVYDGTRWRTYNEKNSCILGPVYNIAFDHSGTAWVAHSYDYQRKIGLTTFEDRPYRIPFIFLALRTLLVPTDPAFRWIIPAILAGVWLLAYLKISRASIAKIGSRVRATFRFQAIHPDDKRWYQAVLAGLPYLLFRFWMGTLQKMSRWFDHLESLYEGYSFDFLIYLPFLIIIPFLIMGWKRGWPVWSGSWASIGFPFIFYAGRSVSWLYAIIPAGILLLIWLSFRDRKTGVLATLSFNLIVSIYLYSDIHRSEFFLQILLEILCLSSFVIVVVRQWVWPTIGGLLLFSSVNTYALMNYNSYYGQSPHLPWIPTDPGGPYIFFLLNLFWFIMITFLPLLLCKKPTRVDGEDKK